MNIIKEICKVIMLSTDKRASIAIRYDSKLVITNYPKSINYQPQHLYIISDKEIKVGDWFLTDNRDNIYENNGIPKWELKQCTSIFNEWIGADNTEDEGYNPTWCRKVIASTNSSLNLPQPHQSFIEVFVNEYNDGNPITEFIFNTTNEDWSKRPVQLDGFHSPKIDENNFITITKNKESWTREEVAMLIQKYRIEKGCRPDVDSEVCNRWIEENL